MMCDDCIYSKDDVCINENTMFSYDGDCLSKIDKESYSKIYNKAIDDFVEEAIKIVYEANNRNKNPHPKDIVADIHYKLLEIAEQLKAGGE